MDCSIEAGFSGYFNYSDDHNELIREVEKLMVEDGANKITIYLGGINGPESVNRLIKSGFLPEFVELPTQKNVYRTEALIDYCVEGLSLEETEFWSEDSTNIDKVFSDLMRHPVFSYASIEGWREFALKTANSLPLALYAKHLLYGSMRPRTEMLLYRQVTSLTYSTVKKLDDHIYLLDDKLFGIPVTRYSDGMSRGLFYRGNDEKNDYCGTFYYYEPESTTFLTFTTSKTYKNKYEAVVDLAGETKNFTEPAIDQYYNAEQKIFTRPMDYPDDMRMTPKEYYENVRSEMLPDAYKDLRDVKHYIGKKIKLYAVEDMYDQSICNIHKKLGTDIVILTHMVGSRQIVTEILDTRERSLSFGALSYPK
tara:strand:+ start:41401 stop:42498 length:1098 start_codon:yes stop_codon:yes gene_type:complete